MSSPTVAGVAPPATRRASGFPHVPALDGIRAIAVLAVLWYHSIGISVGRSLGDGGFLGVSTFFTLSGFLITSLLLTEWRGTGTVDLGQFWSRRLRRLAPAALAVIVAVVVVGQFSFADWGDGLGTRDVLAAATNVMNWFVMAEPADLARNLGPLGPYWSLAVEEQFYVALSLLFLVVRRLAWGRRVLVGVFAWFWLRGLFAALLVHSIPPREMFATDIRATELAAGALLALAVERWGFPVGRMRARADALGWLGLAATLAIVLFAAGDQGWVYAGGLAVMSAVTAALTLGALAGGSLARVLRVTPLVWIGRVSYSVYLVHWPIIRILTSDRVGVAGWALVPVHLAVSLAVAVTLHLAVEQPIRRRWTASPPTVALAWLAATGAVCVVGLALV